MNPGCPRAYRAVRVGVFRSAAKNRWRRDSEILEEYPSGHGQTGSMFCRLAPSVACDLQPLESRGELSRSESWGCGSMKVQVEAEVRSIQPKFHRRDTQAANGGRLEICWLTPSVVRIHLPP